MSYEQEDTAIATVASLAPISSFEEVELSELRWNLQNEIKSILKEKKDKWSLQERVSSYNQVIDTLHYRELSRRADPMRRLPHEIITKILLDVSTSYYYWYPIRHFEDILPLTMVSKRWQSFILAEPLFWNILYLNDQYDRDTLIFLQLQLSRDIPLIVQVTLPLEQWDSVRPELVKYRDRIDTIAYSGRFSLYSSGEVEEMVAKSFRIFLDDLGPLPNLRRLGCTTPRPMHPLDVKDIINRFDSIVNMPNVPFTSGDLQVFKNKSRIDELATFDDPSSIIPIIQTFPNIQKVIMLTTERIWDIDERKESQIDFDSAPPLRWTELVFMRYSNISPAFMGRLSSLVRLEISINIESISNMASNLHRFPHLLDIRVYIVLSSQGPTSLPSDLLPNMSVRSLSIQLSLPIYPRILEVDKETLQNAATNFHRIPRMLLGIMPDVENLNVWLDGRAWMQPFPLLPAIGSFNGSELDLCIYGCEVLLQKEHQIPSSVQRLFLRGSQDLVSYLSSNSAKLLSSHQTPQRASTAVDYENHLINLDLWPSLERISVDKSMVDWGKHSLAFLRRVTIWDSHPSADIDAIRYNEEYNNITSFMKDLACRPESYPSLEEVTLGECPEWDILVIMLERRNLLTDPLVKPISSICMPSLYPRSILRIICGLLAGRWTERPSNKDLSLSGNADIILDLSL
jgi:hypothetical protein